MTAEAASHVKGGLFKKEMESLRSLDTGSIETHCSNTTVYLKLATEDQNDNYRLVIYLNFPAMHLLTNGVSVSPLGTSLSA